MEGGGGEKEAGGRDQEAKRSCRPGVRQDQVNLNDRVGGGHRERSSSQEQEVPQPVLQPQQQRQQSLHSHRLVQLRCHKGTVLFFFFKSVCHTVSSASEPEP